MIAGTIVNRKIVVLFTIATCLMPVSLAWPMGDGDKPAPQQDSPRTYDEKADANADIEAALTRARENNKRALLMFGANWCGWCHKLHGVFKDNGEIAKTLLYEYELVTVDIGRMDKNLEIAKKYGADLKTQGVPYLTVLDGDGKVVVNQETGALEKGDKHDPARVQAFLSKWKAAPLDAQKSFERALAKAASEDKRLFLSFGAPWCGWCHRLSDFLARQDIAKLVSRDFVLLKIDVERMINAEYVQKRFLPASQGGGLPWMVVVDSKGTAMVTSFGSRGNVGFPVEPFEIAHFVDMLKKTAKRMTAVDIRSIEAALQDSAKDLRQGS